MVGAPPLCPSYDFAAWKDVDGRDKPGRDGEGRVASQAPVA
jgi:hypothetical protein